MARLARRTVRWKFEGDDEVYVCAYFHPLHHDGKAEAKRLNEEAPVEDQLGVAAYTNACEAGSAVIVDIDTVEVAD